jgi:soluble lytic murein transglycosylase
MKSRLVISSLITLPLLILVTAVWSSEAHRAVSRVSDSPLLLPAVSALPRTSAVMAMLQAEEHLAAGRPWSAWVTVRPFLATEEAAAPLILLAARAAAGWGAWDEVRLLLRGAAWLDYLDQGEGWWLLAEAQEQQGRSSEAIAAYRSYFAVSGAARAPTAAARIGRLLLAANESAEAASWFAQAARGTPEIEDWLRAFELEARLAAGAADPARLVGAAPAGSAAARLRRARAEVATLQASGDTAAAAVRLQTEIRILSQQGARLEAAGLAIDLGRLYLMRARFAEASELLRPVAWETTLPAPLRVRAAILLGETPEPRGPADELARAAAFEAGGRPAQAARSLRAVAAASAPADPALQLRLGLRLFEAQDFQAARSLLLEAAERLPPGESRAEAELYAARARFRDGDRAGSLTELRRLTDQRPGTAAAGTAYFLLADAAATMEEAVPLYRRAAEIRHGPDAREALLRLGDRQLRLKNTAAAIRALEDFVARYPVGEETAEIAFTVALMHEKAGRPKQAATLFAASTLASPISYHAMRSAEKLGRDHLAAAVAGRPWVGLADDAAQARSALARLDALHATGFEEEWKAELDATVRRLDQRPLAQLVLAEGIRDRGHVVEAIRLGRELHSRRDRQWDRRLLRVVFPLPFRELLEEEAERYQLDPMLFAGLVRQESTFRPAVRSRVGATGLSQIMPATGRWIAPRVLVTRYDYDERLLAVPEVNLGMGALYLSDLLRRYSGARDLALAGYNAGPARADRWRRELHYDRDVDAFREAIPFAETRHYVKVVLRNAWLYQLLYRSDDYGATPRAVSAVAAAAE